MHTVNSEDDLLVLPGDLKEVAPAHVRQVHVDLTMVDGQIVYEP